MKKHKTRKYIQYIGGIVIGVLLIVLVVFGTTLNVTGKGLFGISVKKIVQTASEGISTAYEAVTGAASDAGEAISDAGEEALKETLYTAYKAYMSWVNRGVSGGKISLPKKLKDLLQPYYANNLGSVRIAHTSRFSNLGMTDCYTIYFGNRTIVNNIKDGKKLSQSHFSWLAHELAHTEQCLKVGGRREYAFRWFREASSAAISAIASGRFNVRDIVSAQELAKYEGDMSMERSANQKAAEVTTAAFSKQ